MSGIIIQGEVEMDYKLIQKADKELVYFGVYNTAVELADAGDVLCSVRQKFFESGKRQKNRSTFNVAGEVVRASYTIESGRPLKWKKLIGSRLAERVTIKEKNYYVESLDAERRIFKKAFFDYKHNWIYTEYFLSDNKTTPDCTFAPYTDGNKPAIIIKQGGNTFDTLYPFEVTLDKELTEKLNEAAGEPRVLCRTSCGTFYFCTKSEAQYRQKALETLLSEKDAQENSINEDELIEPGFEVDTSAFEQDDRQNEITSAAADSIPDIPASSDSKEPDIDDILDDKYESRISEDTQTDIPDEAYKNNESDLNQSAIINEAAEPAAADTEIPQTQPDIKASAEGNEEENRMPVQEFSFTDDSESLYEESNTGEEAAYSTEQGELCAFSGQCPYENVDKLIIESGGRQYFYFGDTVGDKRHGFGRTTMFDGKTAYEGSYKDDRREGFGTYYFKSGKLCYAGGWKNNKREGLGAAFSSSDGSIFVGKWHENEPCSVGASFDRDGRLIYAGKTTGSKRSGAGITYSAESDTFFVGKYKDGEFLGSGTQFDSDGNMLYTGSFSGGMRNGEGVSYNKDGSVRYKGLWKNDLYHGQGVLYLEDGCTLHGSFRTGRADGNCTLRDASGRIIYTGGYSSDLYNGAGRLYSEDGGYAEGRFTDGEPSGVFNEYDASGALVYCGEWTDMQRNGKGVEYRNGVKLYEGDFSSGFWNGKGKLFEDGELVYTGSFISGKVSGFGTEVDGDEVVYTGMWESGSYNGCGVLYECGEPRFAGCFRDGKREGRINEIAGGRIIKKCIFENDELTYMCEYSEDGSILYYGNVSAGQRSGMGCSFNSSCEKEFEGIFRKGKPEKAMSVFYRELEALPQCSELSGTDYEKYSNSPEYAVELSYCGGIYTGQIHLGKPEGRGTMLYFDHRYTGMFSNGEPCGSGVIYMRDGSEIVGSFSPEPTSSCETLIFTNLTYYRTDNQ